MKSHPWAPALAVLLALAAGPAAAQITPAVERWSPVGPEGGTITALAVAPGSRRTLYAGTEKGLVFRSTDGGTTWALTRDILSPFAPEAPVAALTVDRHDAALVYAAVCFELIEPPFVFGGIFKSSDGGRSWTQLENHFFNCRVRDVAIDPHDSDVLFATTDFGLFQSLDGGASWQPNVTFPTSPLFGDLPAVESDPFTAGTLFVIHNDLGLHKSTDGGATWTAQNAGLPAAPSLLDLELDPHTPGTLYINAVPSANPAVSPVYRSSDGGATWAPAAEGLGGRRVRDLAAGESLLGTTALYAATPDGVFRSLDGGQSWTAPPASTTARDVLVVAAPVEGAGQAFAGTRHLGVFRSTDGGHLWRAINRNLTGQLVRNLAVASSDPAVLYADIDGLSVRRSDDGGATWRPADAGLPPDDPFDDTFELAVDPRDPRTAFASRHGGIWKTSDGGASWRRTTGPELAPLLTRAPVFDPRTSRTLYVTGFDSGFPAPAPCRGLKSINGGESWFCMGDLPSGNAELVIDPVDPAKLYAGVFDRVWASLDAGLHWADISQGLPSPPQLLQLAATSHPPGTVYAGAFQGLFRRQGSGPWAPVPAPFVNVRDLLTAPSDPTVLYALASSASPPHRPYRSINGGATWLAVTQQGLPGGTVHGLVVHPLRPRELYLLTRAGIYRLSLQ